MFFAKQHHKKGFTLAETILVVAIIAILLAVAAPNVLAYYRQLKLTGLDDDAKTIFMAAQSRLTAMLSAGEELKPAGPGSGEGKSSESGVEFFYITKSDIAGDNYDGLHNYVPGGSIESQLQENNFIVEFVPRTGAVHAVWYWEKDNDNFTYKPNYDANAISRDTRLDEMVGYYGGSEVKRPDLGQMPIPQLDVINAEELRLDIKLPLDDTSGLDNSKVRVSVTISDSEGHEKTVIKGAGLDGSLDANNPEGSLVLDTLKPNSYKKGITTDGDKLEGIGDKFKEWVKDGDITPGDDINVTVVVSYVGTVTIDSKETSLVAQSASASTNSLFASVKEVGTDKVAEIAYGRHLQNLDNGSGVNGTGSTLMITKAEQIRDINFYKTATGTEDPIYYWGSTYAETGTGYGAYADFDPINNNNLVGYDGDVYEIRNIRIDAGGADDGSGLFSSIVSGVYKNITMVNPYIQSKAVAGAIAADTYGEATIDGCRVYNDLVSGKDSDEVKSKFDNIDLTGVYIDEAAETTPSLSGLPHIGVPVKLKTTGGLIGNSFGKIHISNSSCSVVVVGTQQVGGLVGNAGSDVEIENSYAACFLYGNRTVGGLVGLAGGNVEIHNSYAAGEIKDGFDRGFSGAGLFNRANTVTAGTSTILVTNCYSAVKFLNTAGEPVQPDETAQNSGIYGAGVVYGTYKEDALANNNYYIADPDVTFGYGHYDYNNKSDTVSCGNEVSVADLIKEFESQSGWTVDIAKMVANGTLPATAAAGGNKQTTFTHAYNLLKDMNLQVYPYPMLNTTIDIVDENGVLQSGQEVPMAHYGDWVVGANGEATAAYIEKYTDGTYGVYAAKMGADGKVSGTIYNSLDDKVVVDDYYAFISPSDLGEFTLDGGADKYNLTEVTVIDAELQKEIGAGMKLYTPVPASNWDSVTNYYHTIKFEASGKTYLYNTSFACEAFDVTEYVDPAVGGTVDTETILEKPNAAGPGHSFTDGANNLNKATGVVIRSARQLANIQVYTQNTEAAISEASQKWIYDQLANIVFSGTDGYTGTGLTVGKDKDHRLTPAILTSGKYYGHEYKISNLYIGKGTATYAGLFESVGESMNPNVVQLDGVRLVNVNVKGEGATATGGLVGILYGSANNCGIYVEAETGSTITKSYNENWIVTGTGGNGVGGLIGQINGGTVKTSFASVRVDGTGGTGGAGTGPVGGFVGQFTSGSVENCYSGGFVENDSMTSTLTYVSDSVNVTGGGSVGGFVGSVATDSAKFSGIDYSTASVGGPDNSKLGLFAGDNVYDVDKSAVMLNAVAKAFKATTAATGTTYTETAPRDESDYMGGTVTGSVPTEKQPYNQLSTTEFPFPSGQTVHHGDWIEVEAMGVYYDTVNGVTGYYANGKKIDGQTELVAGKPGDGQVATDDGYMFVTEKDLGEKLSIKVGGKDFTMTRESISMKVTVDGIEKTYSYKYEVPAEALNTPTDNYYTAVSINGRIFYANFGAACEIFDTVTDVNTPEEKKDVDGLTDPTGILVRSARQLANIGIRSNETTNEYSSSVEKVYTKQAQTVQKATIDQVLDIDFGTESLASYNKDKLPKVMPKLVAGSDEKSNHVPITMAGGKYYGHEYIIKDLVPGMIEEGVFKDGSVNEVLLESGLFGRVTGGIIDGVRLVNTTVKSDASDVTGSGGSSTKWDPDGDKSYTIKDNHWVDGLSGISGGDDIPAGSEAECTENGFTFSMKWKSDQRGKLNTFSDNPSGFKGSGARDFSTHRSVRFGGGINKDGNYVKFTTTHPALIEVWWQAADNGRDVGIAKIVDGSVEYVKKYSETVSGSDANTTKDGNYYFKWEVESGEYYVGSTGKSGILYGITVTEHTKAADAPGGNPSGTHYTGVDSSKFKVRFGTLVGAVNPADTTNDKAVQIIDCGAYVEEDDTYTTKDEAYNNYMVKNTGAKDTTGGLIGMATKGAYVESSFAAVKVQGVEYVGGFAGHLKNMTVKNCYAGGHTVKGNYNLTDCNVKADASSGTAGGFVGRMEEGADESLTFTGTIYSTASVSAKNQGQFVGLGPADDNWDGYKYTNSEGNEVKSELYGIGDVSKDGTTTDSGKKYLNNLIPVYAAVTCEAHPYDESLKSKTNYPYHTQLKEHYGDWTVRVNFIYYEVYGDDATKCSDDTKDFVKLSKFAAAAQKNITSIKDSDTYGELKVGFYGTLYNGVDDDGVTFNTLSTDGHVLDSGYMIVVGDKIPEIDFSIHSDYGTSGGKTNTRVFNEDAQMDIPTSAGLPDTIAKYACVLAFEDYNLAPSRTFYLDVTINGQKYMLNPYFACEAVNVGLLDGNGEADYNTVRPKKDIKYQEYTNNGNDLSAQSDFADANKENVVLIRSPWNLSAMARYTRDGNTAESSRDLSRGLKFVQLMDIDYYMYAKNRTFDGNPSNKDTGGNSVAGTSDNVGQVPAMLGKYTFTEGSQKGTTITGSYNGYGHTIENLYLSTDTSDSEYTGLFGSVRDGASVENLKLKNINVNAWGGNSKGLYVGTAVAQLAGGTVKNIKLDGVEMDFHKVVYYNEKKYHQSGDAKLNSVGGAIGQIQNGTVENVTVKGLSINFNSGKNEYKYKISKSGDDITSYKKGDGEYTSSVKSDSEIRAGGAIGEIDTTIVTGATAKVTNVYVTDCVIEANMGEKNIVGGLVGRADGKKEADPYNSAQRGAITISDSGVYLTPTEVVDGTTDKFNKGYGVLANDKSSFVGGFVGRTDNYVTVTNCFSAIRVEGAGNVGGFAGDIEGSVIESCYSGGHTENGQYKLDDTDTINVTGVGANTVGGFAGKIESSDDGSLELHGIIYSTSTVTNSGTGSVGRFQGGKDNRNAVKKAAEAGGATVYAVGKPAKSVDAANIVNESDYLLTGGILPPNANDTTFVTESYDRPILDGVRYPYANSTTYSVTGKMTHYGDWEEYAADGAFYWELENGVYHFYTVLYDGEAVTPPESDLCEVRHEDGHDITDWGYGVFTGKDDTGITITGLDEDSSTNANGAKAAIMAKYASAKKVTMIAGVDTKTDTLGTATVDSSARSVFTINPSYAAAIREAHDTKPELGKEGNAYQIRHVQQMDNIGESTDIYFKQTHDVAGKEHKGYTPNTLSGGEYDGGSYRILDLNITATGSDAALFSALENGARVVNTILYGTDGKGVISGENAAGIAASINGGSIKNTIVAGYTITGKTVGGLAAKTTGAVSIANSEATVRREVSKAGGYIGGLVGQVVSDTANTTKISNSYAGGDVVTASGVKLNSGMTYLGGIVGGRKDGTDLKNVVYDTVYSYVAMIKGTGEGKLDFDDEKIKVSGKDTSDFKYVTFYGIGPDVDTDQTDTIGFWSGGIPDPNTDDRALNTALVNLTKWHTNEAKEVYMPNADDYVDGANALTNIASTTPQNRPFPYGGYVKDAEGNPIHYGDWPVAERYAGLFYWEKERVTSVNEYGTEYTADEYHFYAYGAELVRDQLFESDLLEDICHEHHFNERATILESGYGYFLPTASVGATTSDFKFSVMKGSDDVTNSGSFKFDDETSPTVTSIKAELFKKLQLEHTTDGYVVKILNDSGSVNLNKFAEVKDYMWKITAKVGSEEKAFDMRVYPTFGEAIYGDDFDMGEGNDDNVDEVEPMKIRTRLQFERLKANADNKSLDYIVLTHDIDFAEENADGHKAGVDTSSFVDKDKTNYVPGQIRTRIFDGRSYRLFDVKISVTGTKESDKQKYTSTDDIKNDNKGNGSWEGEVITNYNNPKGDAALFLNNRDSGVTRFRNLIIYSPDGSGMIGTTVDGGSAAGIIATANKNYDTIKTTTIKENNVSVEIKYHDKVDSKYTFENCVVAGYTITGSENVGGIVGVATNDNENYKDEAPQYVPMERCEAVVNLVGLKQDTHIGGLAGQWRGKILNCYTGGTIKLNDGVTADKDKTFVGGLAGTITGSGDKGLDVEDCYTYMDFRDASIKDNAAVYTFGEGANLKGSKNYYFDEYAKDVTFKEAQGTKTSYGTLASKTSGNRAENSYWPKDNTGGYYGYVPDAMGQFPFGAVAYIGEKDDPDMYVHYGVWPEGVQAAGVAYYEKDSNGKYSVQIVGVKADSSGVYNEYVDGSLCEDHHVDNSGKISTGHQIVESGYAAFTTKPGTLTVGGGCALTGIGDATTDSGLIGNVMVAIGDLIGGAVPENGIKVYPTVDVKVTDYAAYKSNMTPYVEVKAGGKTVKAYYTNGFAGVSADTQIGANVEVDANGKITNGVPIQIRTVQQLDNLQYKSSNNTNEKVDNAGVYYKQTHDLYGEKYTDSDGKPKYTGVSGFAGTYDGGSYRILELSMEGKAADTAKNVGLFRAASGTIKNVIMYSPSGQAHITNANYNTSTTSSGLYGTGGIVGCSSSDGFTVSNSIVAGYTITGYDMVGGIVGYSFYGGKIESCAAVNDLVGTTTTVGRTTYIVHGMGGITGASDLNTGSHDLEIDNCYAGGSITDAVSGTYVGGIIGYDYGSAAKSHLPVVTNSYSYVNLSETGTVNTIGANLDTTKSTGNYYLDEKIPATAGTQGDGLEFAEIEEKAKSAKAVRTYVPGADGLTPNSTAYQFPAVVKDKGNDEKLVHYGALPEHDPIAQATKGFFYWEKHDSDYHVQYVGENESGDAKAADGLCKDRDGIGISESGFGYFSLGETAVTGGTEGAAVGVDELTGITDALKKLPDVYGKVKVTAFETGTTATNDEWTVGGFSAYVNQGLAKVYTGSSAPTEAEIRTYDQLRQMTGNLNYKQTHDIDASASESVTYTPMDLASGKTYNGGGYRILELKIINTGSNSVVGLFSTVKGTVENVVLYSPSGSAEIKGGKRVGGIAGQLNDNGGSIINCVVAGYNITGTEYVGGIVGHMNSSAKGISNSEAVNKLNGSNSAYIGGIAGRAAGKIENCYAGGEITAGGVSGSKLDKYIGGIYGDYNSSKPTVNNCYTYVDLSNVCSATDYNGKLYTIGRDYSDSGCYYASKLPTTGASTQGTALTNTVKPGSPFTDVSANSSYAPKTPSMTGGVTGDDALTAMSSNFPYPAIFTPDNGGTHEHYGTWLTTTSGAPGMPEGPSFEGMMSAAVPEGLMPEVLALPVNELAGEPEEEGETGEILPPDTPEEVTPEASALPVNELAGEPVEGGETEEILPPDTPEEVTPEASMLPENELAGEPVEEGETEEILPPDTPDAIKPEEFTLPEPENTDDNGDDGHTEIIDGSVSVVRVRRVR